MSLRAALERELLAYWYAGTATGPRPPTLAPLAEATPTPLSRSEWATAAPPLKKRLEQRAAALIAWLLARSPLAPALAAITVLYARARQQSVLRPATQHPPVVVVGNWVVGGGGKTPVVLALVRALRARGFRVAILSNGYGGSREGVLQPEQAREQSGYAAYSAGWSDEAALLGLLSGAAVGVGRNRAHALQQLLATCPKLDLVVSDDGLQHPGLPRRGEIGLLDGRGFGNLRCLPIGPLREPIESRPRSDWLILRGLADSLSMANHSPGIEPRQKVDRVSEATSHTRLCKQLANQTLRWELAPLRVVTWSTWTALSLERPGLQRCVPDPAGRPAGPQCGPTAEIGLSSASLEDVRKLWKGRRILGLAGIAHPEQLMAQCARAGIQAEWLRPGDHRKAKLSAVRSINEANIILLTAKDAVKYTQLDDRFHVLIQDESVPAALITWLEQLILGPAPA